ncbi:MAG TPA: biopolymer transporter ExbD [Polyangia bacterium]|nr:biopolymer transporter ExbD [Polyangia bacterium]
MAVSIDGGGGNRKKPLNADLNLVPYIDLLTCMVAFLLITAVWTQLARLKIDQRGQGTGEETETAHKTNIAVVVHEDGFNLIVGDDQKPLPMKAGDLDYATLAVELAAVKHAYPDRTDVKVVSADGIVFDKIVRTMDATMSAGFADLSLLDAVPGS